MKKSLLLAAALLISGAALAQNTVAQTNIAIPALPPGTSAPATAATSDDPLYPSGYRLSQLQAALPLLDGLKTLQASTLDQQRGRLVVTGLSAVDRLELLKRLSSAGLPMALVEFRSATINTGTGNTSTGTTGTVTQTPPNPTTLPEIPATSNPPVTPPTTPTLPTTTTLPATGRPMDTAVQPLLSGPSSIRAGEANTWAFSLKNNGTQGLKLAHGACDVRFEVISAAGVIVRPDPKNTLCTMQIVYTDVGAGETATVQNIRWDGKDAQGQTVPAGTYTIRAVFNGSGMTSKPAVLTVTVR